MPAPFARPARRHLLVLGWLVVLGACRKPDEEGFLGVWEAPGHRLEIGARGLGTGHVLHQFTDATFTWKRVAQDRIELEFGQKSSTRTSLEARLIDADTLVVSNGRKNVSLARGAAAAEEAAVAPRPGE